MESSAPEHVPPPVTTLAWLRRKMTFKLIASLLVGALGGYAYHRIIGCRSGACPITANPYISSGYGAMIGYFISGGWS